MLPVGVTFGMYTLSISVESFKEASFNAASFILSEVAFATASACLAASSREASRLATGLFDLIVIDCGIVRSLLSLPVETGMLFLAAGLFVFIDFARLAARSSSF